jgi:hypothetical protein
VATVTPVPISISRKATEQKSGVRTRLPLDVTLDSATNKKTGYVEWPALIEQLQTDRVCKTKLAAAVYIRRLIDTGKLYLIPCAQTASVCFSREKIKNSLAITAEDERKIQEQTAAHTKELNWMTEHAHRKRSDVYQKRKLAKHREELLRK